MTNSEIERAFYVREVGGADPQEPLANIKRRYYSTLLTVNSSDKMGTLEQNFLKYIITSNLGTPSGTYVTDLLKQALSILGIEVSRNVEQNWRNLYQNYNP